MPATQLIKKAKTKLFVAKSEFLIFCLIDSAWFVPDLNYNHVDPYKESYWPGMNDITAIIVYSIFSKYCTILSLKTKFYYSFISLHFLYSFIVVISHMPFGRNKK
jgi:hypothetical protein